MVDSDEKTLQFRHSAPTMPRVFRVLLVSSKLRKAVQLKYTELQVGRNVLEIRPFMPPKILEKLRLFGDSIEVHLLDRSFGLSDNLAPEQPSNCDSCEFAPS